MILSPYMRYHARVRKPRASGDDPEIIGLPEPQPE